MMTSRMKDRQGQIDILKSSSTPKPKGNIPLRPKPNASALLQRSIGNRNIQRFSDRNISPPLVQRKCACGGTCSTCAAKEEQGIQTKLKVGASNDRYEQEADQVASQIMRMSDISRQSDEEEEEVIQPKIQRVSTNGDAGFDPGPDFQISRNGGQSLSASTRQFMEPRFGADFGNVRIHKDAAAQQSSAQINAKAFTSGNHIWMSKGASEGDKTLMAHELTHVIQQGATEASHHGMRSIQRYSQQDCDETLDLRPHIWPGDHIARQMVTKAIRVLSASPIDPLLTPLFSKYFMTATPSISTIKGIFTKIETDFSGNSYQYECENDCDGTTAYVYGIWTDIHLCMNILRGRGNDCFASTIIHEFCHYSAGLDDESGRCYGCGSFPGCPTSLSVSDALDNADSYAAFAYELYPMSV